MEVDGLGDELQKAKEVAEQSADEGLKRLKAIVLRESDDFKVQEKATNAFCEVCVKHRRPEELKRLQVEIRPFLQHLPKAKGAKLVRQLIDQCARIPGTEADQIEMVTDCIAWCAEEKRTFLRRRVETRLCQLYLNQAKYQLGLELLGTLLYDVKKLDDKLLLVEIHLIECKTHFAVGHIPKAKAALTASKTNANAIHCPPLLQAEIDLWSGLINAREKDFRTAYSYFFESFEAFHVSGDDAQAKHVLKYMLLNKVMMHQPREARSLAESKACLKYSGAELDAILAVAKALETRSLHDFEGTLTKYPVLKDDHIIEHHISDLNETLLEQNLMRIIEPFSRVEVAHVAELIKLPMERVQQKLSERILDKKITGTLDQGQGSLILPEPAKVRDTYDCALQSIKNTQQVLDTLYQKALLVK